MLLPEASLKQVKGLVHLRICLGDSFDDLTTSRALSTPSLTHLDLGCNGFTCLPPALARLTELVHLDLSICDRLQLKWPHTSAEIIRQACCPSPTFGDCYSPRTGIGVPLQHARGTPKFCLCIDITSTVALSVQHSNDQQ